MQRRQFLGAAGTVGALGGLGLAGSAFDVLAQRTPDVIFVPTDFQVVTQMLKLAEVTSKDIVYDLGCGDGRFVVTAAQQFGARGVGMAHLVPRAHALFNAGQRFAHGVLRANDDGADVYQCAQRVPEWIRPG